MNNIFWIFGILRIIVIIAKNGLNSKNLNCAKNVQRNRIDYLVLKLKLAFYKKKQKEYKNINFLGSFLESMDIFILTFG